MKPAGSSEVAACLGAGAGVASGSWPAEAVVGPGDALPPSTGAGCAGDDNGELGSVVVDGKVSCLSCNAS